jgi:hypothetical protein
MNSGRRIVEKIAIKHFRIIVEYAFQFLLGNRRAGRKGPVNNNRQQNRAGKPALYLLASFRIF